MDDRLGPAAGEDLGDVAGTAPEVPHLGELAGDARHEVEGRTESVVFVPEVAARIPHAPGKLPRMA
jgi:hypothetical protein